MGKKNTGATFSSSRFGVRVSVVPNFFTIYPQHFLKPENSETLLGSFTKFFGTVKQTFFDGNLWYHLLCINIFDIPIFWKHWTDAHEIFFSTVRPKKFDGKRDTPLFIHKTFRNQNFFKNSWSPLRSFSALWDKNFSSKNRDTLLHKVWKSVVELMFVRTLWRLISKQ